MLAKSAKAVPESSNNPEATDGQNVKEKERVRHSEGKGKEKTREREKEREGRTKRSIQSSNNKLEDRKDYSHSHGSRQNSFDIKPL
jgi:hypothetical protein